MQKSKLFLAMSSIGILSGGFFPIAYANPTIPCTSANTCDWGSTYVTPVYNEGQCGASFAFVATEAIESQKAISGHGLTQLSMQQVVSCDTTDTGCEGGSAVTALDYIINAGGLEAYSTYPYASENGTTGSCAVNNAHILPHTVPTYQSVTGESGLYAALQNGPVIVGIDGSTLNPNSYQGGVLTSCGNQVDSWALVTGYTNYSSSYNGESAWHVRFAYGTGFGQNGYADIATGEDLCSIGDYAFQVTEVN